MQGQLDVALDDVGRAQAHAAAEVLAEAAPVAVVTSDLSRALETARPLAAASGVALTSDPRLRELDLGSWQGLTAAQAQERYPEEYAAWRAGADVSRGGGETYRTAGERAAACLQEALSGVPAGETLVAVTHGGTARAALGVLLDVEPARWGRFAPLGNCCWSVLVEAGWGWRLERHNAGLGPLVGPATGAHDLGSRPVGGPAKAPDVSPVE
jgi:broad specificity phosphatase PhoE